MLAIPRGSGSVLMLTDDRFDQRLEELRKEILRSGEKGKKTGGAKVKVSRLDLPIWLLALSTFVGAIGYMWHRMPINRLGSFIIAALIAAIALFIMQLAKSLAVNSGDRRHRLKINASQ